MRALGAPPRPPPTESSDAQQSQNLLTGTCLTLALSTGRRKQGFAAPGRRRRRRKLGVGGKGGEDFCKGQVEPTQPKPSSGLWFWKT